MTVLFCSDSSNVDVSVSDGGCPPKTNRQRAAVVEWLKGCKEAVCVCPIPGSTLGPTLWMPLNMGNVLKQTDIHKIINKVTTNEGIETSNHFVYNKTFGCIKVVVKEGLFYFTALHG